MIDIIQSISLSFLILIWLLSLGWFFSFMIKDQADQDDNSFSSMLLIFITVSIAIGMISDFNISDLMTNSSEEISNG